MDENLTPVTPVQSLQCDMNPYATQAASSSSGADVTITVSRAVPLSLRRISKLRSVEAFPGPETPDHLGMWDVNFGRQLRAAGKGQQMSALLRNGAIAFSDFSGYDAPSEACRAGLPSIFEELGAAPPFVDWVRSCDIGKPQQRILVGMSRLVGGKHCVFNDVMDRLPELARDDVANMLPDGGMRVQKKRQCNEKIRAYLNENSSSVFAAEATAPCKVHGCRCFVNPGFVVNHWHTKQYAPLHPEGDLFGHRFKNHGQCKLSL